MGLKFVEEFYSNYSVPFAVQVIISIAAIFLVAFLLTRITKLLKLPNVTAYMFTGILIGPFVLNLIPDYIRGDMSNLSDLGLAIIGFSCGRFLDLKLIKDNGWKPVIISLFDCFVTTIVIFLIGLAFDFPVIVSLILGIVAASTSGASIIMTIRQYNCKGNFVNYTIEIIALNNLIVLLLFSILVGIAPSLLSLDASVDMWSDVGLPILLNVGMLFIGALMGLILGKVFIKPSRTKDNRLILTVAAMLVLVGLCGLCQVFGDNVSVSPLMI